MAKSRSPNCPQINLEDALAKVRQVYKKEHTHPAERQVIAGDMGYKSLNGASLTVLGALRQYGLLEDAAEGMRVSDDAVAILELPEDDIERVDAMLRLALKPPLFHELNEQFGDKLPSEANLRHTLIKKGFLPRAADEVIRVYRENLELVGAPEEGYDGSRRDENMATNEHEDRQPDTRQRPRNQSETAQATGFPSIGGAASKSMEISLPVGTSESGEIVFATVRFSAGIKRNLVASLRTLLEAMEKTLPEGA